MKILNPFIVKNINEKRTYKELDHLWIEYEINYFIKNDFNKKFKYSVTFVDSIFDFKHNILYLMNELYTKQDVWIKIKYNFDIHLEKMIVKRQIGL